MFIIPASFLYLLSVKVRFSPELGTENVFGFGEIGLIVQRLTRLGANFFQAHINGSLEFFDHGIDALAGLLVSWVRTC